MLSFTTEGIYCAAGDFYIDPWKPVDKAVITHGHADHARPGMNRYLCHHYTRPILKSRLGSDINIESLGYHEPLYINGVRLSLHPAGHIIGSAQVRIEYRGKIAVVSGDYKIQDDGISHPFEPVKCHEFITESTFGLPIYNWLPVATLQDQIRQWVINNQSNGKTSVFVGYSLGKAQRIMKALEGVSPLHVHFSIGKLNRAYEEAGIHLPEYRVVDLREDLRSLKKTILIVPPALLDSNLLKKVPDMANAICSGWMQVRGARRWRSADAGFAVSDHADWKGLLSAVKETGAEKVFVTHGQTAVFSKYPNECGIQAGEVKTEFGGEEEGTDLPPDPATPVQTTTNGNE